MKKTLTVAVRECRGYQQYTLKSVDQTHLLYLLRLFAEHYPETGL